MSERTPSNHEFRTYYAIGVALRRFTNNNQATSRDFMPFRNARDESLDRVFDSPHVA